MLHQRLRGRGRSSFSPALLFLVTWLACWHTVRGAEATDAEATDDARLWAPIGALVSEYCLDCHSGEAAEAGLALDAFEGAEDVGQGRDRWTRILEHVRFGAMPPEGERMPTDDERARFVEAVEELLEGAACDLEAKPAKVTVRRLNRAEYNNSIRDLFGLDMRPADDFPSDEVGDGFDNNGNVLSLPPLLFEKYIKAAEQVASAAILTPEEVPDVHLDRSADTLKVEGDHWVDSFVVYTLLPQTKVHTSFDVPIAGRYELKVRGEPANEPRRMVVAVSRPDGQRLGEFEVGKEKPEGSRGPVELELPEGELDVVFEIVEVSDDAKPMDDSFERGESRSGRSGWFLKKGQELPGTAFTLRKILLEGPIGFPTEAAPEFHRELIRTRPGDDRSVIDAAAENLQPFLARVFRSPVDEETARRYASLVQAMVERDLSFERGHEAAVAAALVSPRFLYRTELSPDDAAPGSEVPLNQYQIASRLSYFLWSSTPDDQLLQLAAEGQLSKPEVLEEQVGRMLADERAGALADNFAGQWLGLRNIDSFEVAPQLGVEFDDQLREAMKQETKLLFMDTVRNNRSVLDLLDSERTFLNERLAQHYGVEGVKGEEFRPVSVAEAGRKGILTHASVLTLTSNPNRTSPVKRGKWVLENILGSPPPDPPPGVPELEDAGESTAGLPIRRQLEIHRQNPTCASCHRSMDGLGFGLENFDAVGRWRTEEAGQPIDASGNMPDGTEFRGAAELVRLLRESAAAQFATRFSDRLMTFALGRQLTAADRCTIEEIVAAAEADGYRMHDLLMAIVQSDAFLKQTTPE